MLIPDCRFKRKEAQKHSKKENKTLNLEGYNNVIFCSSENLGHRDNFGHFLPEDATENVGNIYSTQPYLNMYEK